MNDRFCCMARKEIISSAHTRWAQAERAVAAMRRSNRPFLFLEISPTCHVKDSIRSVQPQYEEGHLVRSQWAVHGTEWKWERFLLHPHCVRVDKWTSNWFDSAVTISWSDKKSRPSGESGWDLWPHQNFVHLSRTRTAHIKGTKSIKIQFRMQTETGKYTCTDTGYYAAEEGLKSRYSQRYTQAMNYPKECAHSLEILL